MTKVEEFKQNPNRPPGEGHPNTTRQTGSDKLTLKSPVTARRRRHFGSGHTESFLLDTSDSKALDEGDSDISPECCGSLVSVCLS